MWVLTNTRIKRGDRSVVLAGELVEVDKAEGDALVRQGVAAKAKAPAKVIDDAGDDE